ncbi:conserved hypothetical protein [Verrucomicrobia bacterium]|nr:conserved hypothetical protein [Verrucomicrobiota bacterium]
MDSESKLTPEIRLSFRDQFREARFKAQKDAEAFEEIVFVLERLGTLLSPGCCGLGTKGRPGKRDSIIAVASKSPLFNVPHKLRELHTPLEELYDLVVRARNDAMHEGATARHATERAIELSLVLESALMNSYSKVSDFMVRNPVCAEMWEPLRFIRQKMLVNAFSWLPVRPESGAEPRWQLVSDKAMAQYLVPRSKGKDLNKHLDQQLKEAVEGGGVELIPAQIRQATDAVESVLAGWDGQPVLVTLGERNELLGILTPHDLL